MTPISRTYGDVSLTLYYLNAGEEVERHQHPFSHTTAVYVGRARVDIFSPTPQSVTLTRTDPDITLPPNIDHLITALDDGTVVGNAAIGLPPSGPPAASGGIMLASGCVVSP